MFDSYKLILIVSSSVSKLRKMSIENLKPCVDTQTNSLLVGQIIFGYQTYLECQRDSNGW